MNFSKYQTDVFDHVANNPQHLIVSAVAGSGKTTTIIEAARRLPDYASTAMVAFNKAIQQEFEARLSLLGKNSVTAKTYHALGLDAVKASRLYRPKVEQSKAVFLLKRHYDYVPHSQKMAAAKAWEMLRYNLLEPSPGHFAAIVAAYEIPVQEQWADIVYQMVVWLSQVWLGELSMIDYADMIYLPVADDRIRPRKYDFVFADEVQDTNAAELALLEMSTGGKFIGVGDRRQAIYGFAGAGTESVDVVKARLGADELPLSISYRCPRAVGQLINQEFPEIPFRVAENAPEGVVRRISAASLEAELRPGDMVLCRVNSDLVSLAVDLLASGKPAAIKGRDLGERLIALIDEFRPESAIDLMRAASEWGYAEAAKWRNFGLEQRAAEVADRAEILVGLAARLGSVEAVKSVISTLFQSSSSAGKVLLSSGHRAKGLEAERVYIIRPDLLPHPAAKKEGEVKQEMNLKYVMYSRSKMELVICD